LCSIYLSSCRLVRCHQDTRPLPTRRSSDLVSTGSTADLLEGVAEAMDAGETVAATFWSPHRALDELPLRFLQEPQRQLVERPMRRPEGRGDGLAGVHRLRDALQQVRGRAGAHKIGRASCRERACVLVAAYETTRRQVDRAE